MADIADSTQNLTTGFDVIVAVELFTIPIKNNQNPITGVNIVIVADSVNYIIDKIIDGFSNYMFKTCIKYTQPPF